MKNETAIQLLKEDHVKVKELFREFEEIQKSKTNSAKKKQEIVKEITRELEIHSKIEEEFFYPAVKNAKKEELKEDVLEAIEAHAIVKNLLSQLSKMSPTDEKYDAKVTVLIEEVEHHVKEEEGEMFPEAKKYLSSERLEAIGVKMQERKELLLEQLTAPLALK